MRSIVAAALLTVVPGLAVQAQQSSVAQRNQDIIRQQFELLNRGDLEAAAAFFADDVQHQGSAAGRESRLRVLHDIYDTFPDWRMEIEEMVADGDSVVVRCTVSGTHRGVGKLAVNGAMLVGVPPTNKRFSAQHIHWYKLRDGKITEHFATRDDIGMMRQLGLLPPTGLPTVK